jgi:hypothetical protein
MSYLGDKDFLIEVAKGNVAGHSLVHKFGRNPDVDTGTVPEDIWFTGGLMNWPTSAAVVSVVSDDANDDGNPTTNTGAQTLTIEGLDASFNELSETITLNGVGAVTTSASFIRVSRAFVATTGTYHGNNEGTLVGTISGATQFTIGPGLGQTQVGRYTVPNGKTAYLLFTAISVDEKKSGATVQLFQNPLADDTSQPFSGAQRMVIEFDTISGQETLPFGSPRSFAGKTDLWFEIPTVGADNTPVDVDFELLLVDD